MIDQYRIKKSKLSGEIAIPPSKSQTLRAILFASLAKGKSVIHHYLHSPDTFAMVEACRLFGAAVDLFPDRIEINGIHGRVHHAEDVIDSGNSGIVLRFCSAIGALGSHPFVLTGDYSIRHHRPMKQLLHGLSQLGVSVSTMRGDGYAPVIIQGPITKNKATIEGDDSQPVSALLIASAFAEFPIELHVKNAGEKPWVSLTLNWFDRLEISYKNNDYSSYSLAGKADYEGFEYNVPGDLSSAAFPVAAALVTQSDLTIKNVNLKDPQGDKEILAVFKNMGAHIETDEQQNQVHVKKGKSLAGVTVDINNFIDGLPILAVVACFADGETHIKNGSIAKQKECNRIACISSELKKMGGDLIETEDGLIIKKSSLQGAAVHSHQDHRLAMSLSVAGLGSIGETTVSPVECIKKTFATFKTDFNRLGALIE